MCLSEFSTLHQCIDSKEIPVLDQTISSDGVGFGCYAGGRVDLFHASAESQKAISGIFIKHVLESSPAGRNGTLKTGDRILEVSLPSGITA